MGTLKWWMPALRRRARMEFGFGTKPLNVKKSSFAITFYMKVKKIEICDKKYDLEKIVLNALLLGLSLFIVSSARQVPNAI